jgi:hypothetical protein
MSASSRVKETPSVLWENPATIRSTPETEQSIPIVGAEIEEAGTTRLCVILRISPPISKSVAVVRSVTEAHTAVEPKPVTDEYKSFIIPLRSERK